MKPLTIKTSSLLYLLLLACTTLTAFSQSDRVDCDPDNRPDSQDCFQPNSTFEATCAYYTENCPFELCGRDVSNACAACSDSSVIYHRPQACDPEIVVSECSEGVCDSEFDPQSERVFEPVCGFRRGCTGNDCSRTFTNICQACSNSNYPWYQNGVCEDDRKYCGRKEKCSSPSSSNAVCAFFDTEDGGKDQHATVRNARTACTDSAVNYFTKGECEGSSRDNTTYCLPNNRPGFCTKEYNPVCGFYFSEEDEGVLEHKVLGNPCIACHDPSIIYHQPGPCIFTCNRNPNVIFECDGVTVDPVCGSYQEDGEPRQISLKNACIGCYGISTLIDNYTDGLCPGDEGIRCENDAGGFLIGRIFPVCGVFEEGCNDSSCRQTYSESVVACNDENVVLFNAGLCPGDEGVSCAPFRSRPESPNFLSDINYQDVCGYREAGCDDDSCRETFEDQYAACGDSAVEFFTAGPCA